MSRLIFRGGRVNLLSENIGWKYPERFVIYLRSDLLFPYLTTFFSFCQKGKAAPAVKQMPPRLLSYLLFIAIRSFPFRQIQCFYSSSSFLRPNI